MSPETVEPLTALSVQQTADPDYWTIEGMRSQEFSVGIFIFLVICVVVFSGAVVMYARTGKGASLKTGEKVLLGWIIFGIFAGVAMGVMQLLQGRLF